MRANAEVGVRKTPTTTLPSSSAVPLTVDFFRQLAHAELTAVGYQVLFWHLERLIRHRMTSEAVPLETIAQSLGLHRNAVGKAYAALAAAGLVRRQEVHQRGAPTRTRLEGIAINVVLQATGMRTRPTPVTNAHHASVPTGTRAPSQLGQEPSRDHREPTRMPEPLGALAPAGESMVCPATLVTETEPVYSVELQAQALAKLPPLERYEAMQGRLTADAIDPAWNLSDEERDFALGMTRHEAKPQAKMSTCIKPVPTKAPKALATVLLQHRRQFESLVDGGALSQLGQAELEAIEESSTLTEGLLDQIAFMISKGGLGRGDVYAGVRAARSLVANGRWTLPWSFTRDWYGAVRRGAEGAL